MSEEWQTRLGALGVEPVADDGLTLHEAVAFTARRKGLAKLDELPPDIGLHIYRCDAVHTFGMRFSLDLIWRDRQGAVVRLNRSVPPRRQSLCVRARTVVEVAAGGADRWVAALGDIAPPGSRAA